MKILFATGAGNCFFASSDTGTQSFFFSFFSVVAGGRDISYVFSLGSYLKVCVVIVIKNQFDSLLDF